MSDGEPLARARRVGPPGEELNAPTLDGTLTAVTTPPRRRHDPDTPRARRLPPPRGADPLALGGLLFGALAATLACVWPLSGPAGLVAVACGLAGLNGRSRPLAVAAAALGVSASAAALGVAVMSLALATHEPPAGPPPQKPVWGLPVVKVPPPFLPA